MVTRLTFTQETTGSFPVCMTNLLDVAPKEERLVWDQQVEIAKFSIQTNFTITE